VATRTVKVSLVASTSNYLADMEKAANKTRQTGTEAEKLSQKMASQSKVFDAAGKGMFAIGAIAATAVGLAVSKFAEFDQAMSNVQASTHETEGNMALLEKAAIAAGASTVFSATEAANAIDELAKAGVSTANIIGGGLSGALDLASAGGLDVATAAEIAATAMTQFGLAGSEVPHIADLLAAGAGKAQGSVEDLGAALGQSGIVAANAGQSIEGTTGTLAAFASAGLKGSDAGTSLKSMLLALQGPSDKASATLKQYGIEVYDAQGNMKSFEEIAGELRGGLGDLTQEQRNAALATIFGSDAVRSANILYAQGSEGIANWGAKVNDAGFAAETARLKLDNLNGDVEKLGGAFDTALIGSGGAANGALRALTQTATGLVDGFNSMPSALQSVALGLAVTTAGVGLLGGGFLIAAPRIIAAKAALADMDITVGKVGKNIGKAALAGAALAGAAGAVSSFSKEIQLSADQVAKLDNVTKGGSLKALNAEFVNTQSNAKGLGDVLKKEFSGDFFTAITAASRPAYGAISAFTGGLIDLNKQSDTNRAKFKELGNSLVELAGAQGLPAATEQFGKYVKAAGGGEEATKNLLKAMPEYKAALVNVLTEQGRAASGQEILNLAMGKGPAATQAARDAEAAHTGTLSEMAGQAIDTESAIEGLSEELRNFGQTVYDSIEAESAFYEATEAAAKSVGAEGFTATLNLSTEAGRKNMSQLTDIGQATNEFAAATYDSSGSVVDLNAKLDEGRKRLYDAARSFGATEDEANNYANTLIATPSAVQTRVELTGVSAAQAIINDLVATKTKSILIRATTGPDLNGAASGSGRPGLAAGGAVHGPGTGTSDTAGLYRLSNGEHVLTAKDVARLGGQAGVYAMRNQLQRGAIATAMDNPAVSRPRYAEYRGLAVGGAVNPAQDYSRNPVQYAPVVPINNINVSPEVSLRGATLTMSVGGREIQAVIQDQIIDREAVHAQNGRAGKQRRW
jgi:TP901 family phage tail tape measure protein